jgi:hypothetical protein
VKASHLYVPDKHAERKANDEEMEEFRVECKRDHPEDKGPDNPLEIFSKNSSDPDFKRIPKLAQGVKSRYKLGKPGTFECPLAPLS